MSSRSGFSAMDLISRVMPDDTKKTGMKTP